METKNAIIKSARIFIEDHGILTAFLDLDYGGVCQGFGGYALERTAGEFIRKTLDVVGVASWDQLVGKTVRVTADRNKIYQLGHIVNDRWFDPSTMGKI